MGAGAIDAVIYTVGLGLQIFLEISSVGKASDTIRKGSALWNSVISHNSKVCGFATPPHFVFPISHTCSFFCHKHRHESTRTKHRNTCQPFLFFSRLFRFIFFSSSLTCLPLRLRTLFFSSWFKQENCGHNIVNKERPIKKGGLIQMGKSTLA